MKKIILVCLFFLSNNIVQAQYSVQVAFPTVGNFFIPMELVNSGDGTNRLFLAERSGTISVFKNDPASATRSVFLNISSLLTGTYAELLGLAFHPDFETNRFLYVSYFYESGGAALLRVARFEASSINPNIALLSTQVNIMTFQQPSIDHNGGKIQFGPDGFLYWSTGDGGFGGLYAGNKTLLCGKVLRIDVDNPAGGLNYSIPVSNPYYNNTLGYKQEIYASGFRNPWKFDIDEVTNRLFLGDVGHFRYEEVNLIEGGKDYGWNKMEGFHCFPGDVCDTAGRGLTLPIWEYPHGGLSKAITGGFVYRGHLRDELYGKFIYCDYIDGNLYALTYNGATVVNTLLMNLGKSITTFGIGEDNELYLCDFQMGIYKFYPHFQMGDINQDGMINLLDLILVFNDAQNFVTGNVDTDLNFDMMTGLVDIAIVSNHLQLF